MDNYIILQIRLIKKVEAKNNQPQRDSSPQSSDSMSDALSVGLYGLKTFHFRSNTTILQVSLILKKQNREESTTERFEPPIF